MIDPRPTSTTPTAASSIAYLFADRFIPAQAPGRATTVVQSNGAAVSHVDLARHLPVIALWSLREIGAVDLAEYHEKKLGFIPSNGVRATLRQTVASSGIEGALLAGLTGSGRAQSTGVDVNALVRDLVPVSSNPYTRLLARSIDDAVALGLLRRVGDDVGVVGRLVGKSTSHVEPVAQGIVPLDAAASDLAARFAAFRTGESALYLELLQQSSRGLKARERRDDD
jgi:hypothetical protein